MPPVALQVRLQDLERRQIVATVNITFPEAPVDVQSVRESLVRLFSLVPLDGSIEDLLSNANLYPSNAAAVQALSRGASRGEITVQVREDRFRPFLPPPPPSLVGQGSSVQERIGYLEAVLQGVQNALQAAGCQVRFPEEFVQAIHSLASRGPTINVQNSSDVIVLNRSSHTVMPGSGPLRCPRCGREQRITHCMQCGTAL